MLVPAGSQLTKKELEKKVAADITDFMKKKGWRKFRHQSAMVSRLVAGGADQMFRVGEKGMADLQFIYYLSQEKYKGLNATVWIETKRSKGGVLSEDQVQWQETERSRGGLVVNASNVQEYAQWYAENLSWVHNLKGQAELF